MALKTTLGIMAMMLHTGTKVNRAIKRAKSTDVLFHFIAGKSKNEGFVCDKGVGGTAT
jgi:hypothetical protein